MRGIQLLKEHVPYTKEVIIHEHKAPTDESLKLLKEMQEKALASIVKTIPAGSNKFKATGTIYKESINHNLYKIFFKFKLNDNEYTVTVCEKMSQNSLSSDSKGEMVEELVNEVAKVIVREGFIKKLNDW